MQGSWLPSERSDVEAYVEKLIDEVATDPSSCISTIGFPNSMPKTSCNRNRKEALEQLGNIVYCPQGITFQWKFYLVITLLVVTVLLAQISSLVRPEVIVTKASFANVQLVDLVAL